MQTKKYSFCNCNVEIKYNTSISDKFDYSLFLSDFETADFSFEVENVDLLPPKNGNCIFSSELNSVYVDGDIRKNYTAFWDNEKQCAKDYTCKLNDKKLYASCPGELNEFHIFEGLRLPELLLEKGIGLLHCSFIEVDGQAILFSGDKQVGKSTQAALWAEYGSATVINGDRAGIFAKDGVIYAGGVPYSGTSGICVNKQMPVKAIVCLSKGTTNTIKRFSAIEGFTWLLNKLYYKSQDENAVNSVVDILNDVVSNVPIYSYSCVKDESAVDFLKNALERMA